MTRNHFQKGDASRIRMLVLHSTAGRYPGDYTWLRNGGNQQRPVSIHYYIDKSGTISQMVADADIAWHCGYSNWEVDGKPTDNCNLISLGIELENLNNGRDPYPQEQYDAALWLSRTLVQQYNIPRSQLVRHLDISPGRKTDPAGFPWEQFVNQVYGEAVPAQPPVANDPAVVLPTKSPELRKMLLEVAFRAAGGAAPQHWPLLKEAINQQTGMPVMMIDGAFVMNTSSAGFGGGGGGSAGVLGASQDDLARPVLIDGTFYVLEAYARDLFYAELNKLDQVRRLSETPAGALRTGLLQALFRAADPTNGYQESWAFHSYFLEHSADIGVPISPNHRLEEITSDGQAYVCQHFALDTLCSPVGRWQTVIRLSDLVKGMVSGTPLPEAELMTRYRLSNRNARELRTMVLNDLYRTRTGRNFDQRAVFCQFALSNNLGAPIGQAETTEVEGRKLLMMPFALDVVYCRIPDNGDWRVPVGQATTLGGRYTGRFEPTSNEPPMLLRLSDMFSSPKAITRPRLLGGAKPAQPKIEQPLTGYLLGAPIANPRMQDLTPYVQAGVTRMGRKPDVVVIYPADGPSQTDLRAAMRQNAAIWHYYIDRSGLVTRLIDEELGATAAAHNQLRHVPDLNLRSLAIAVEGAANGVTPNQGAALTWLIRSLLDRFALNSRHVITTTRWMQHTRRPSDQPLSQNRAS
jgi:N-acetyl-anhydromuramyl-L-alanine amidase AmpD